MRIRPAEAEGTRAGAKRRRSSREDEACEGGEGKGTVAWTHGKAACGSGMGTGLLEQAGGSSSSMGLRALWRVALDKCVDASPLLVGHNDHTVSCVVGSHAGTLVSIDMESGAAHWRTTLPDRLEASCSCANAAPQTSGCLQGAVAAEKEESTPRLVQSAPYAESCEQSSSPRGIVLVGGHDQHLHAVRLDDGVRLWSRRFRGVIKAAATILPQEMLPGHRGGRVAIGVCFGGLLAAVDVCSGRTLWAGSCEGPCFATPLVDAARSRVLVADLRGHLQSWRVIPSRPRHNHRHSALHLERSWRFCVHGHKPIFSSPALASWGAKDRGSQQAAAVVFGCADGKVYAICCESGACLWAYEARSPVFCAPCIVPSTVAGAADGAPYVLCLLYTSPSPRDS